MGKDNRPLTGLPGGASAVEAAHPIDASGPVEAGGSGAVVDVDGAVGAGPAVDADTGESSHAVGARGAVLAHGGPGGALVHVLLAEATRVRGRAFAHVGVDAIDAGGAVLALVAGAVVDVFLAV